MHLASIDTVVKDVQFGLRTMRRSVGFRRFGQDPITLAASAGFLLVVSIVAMVWPVWRATSGSPVAALRYEGHANL